MSRYLDKDKFDKFLNERKQDAEARQAAQNANLDNVWPTPKKGTKQEPMVYKLRFLTDSNGNFYRKYFYHMFKKATGDGWNFIFCPKSHSLDEFCPVCAITSKLYNSGSDVDKALGGEIKRKLRFVGNVFVVDDPRDANQQDDENKHTNKVYLYQFPEKVEKKLLSQLGEGDNCRGMSIFDPGEEGYTFLLKVGETDPTKEGKTFYSYDDSEFALKNTSLGSEKEIEEILEHTHSIDEFFKSMEQSNEEIIEILDNERLLPWIQEELERFGYIKVTKDESKNETKSEDVNKQQEDKSASTEDDDLLKELEELSKS